MGGEPGRGDQPVKSLLSAAQMAQGRRDVVDTDQLTGAEMCGQLEPAVGPVRHPHGQRRQRHAGQRPSRPQERALRAGQDLRPSGSPRRHKHADPPLAAAGQGPTVGHVRGGLIPPRRAPRAAVKTCRASVPLITRLAQTRR